MRRGFRGAFENYCLRGRETIRMKTAKSHLKRVSVAKAIPVKAQSTQQIKLEAITEAIEILRSAERAAPWLK